MGQREPTLRHVFWRGKAVIRAVAQKQESTHAQQRKEQHQKCNSLKNFTCFPPPIWQITWTEFPEVIEVSIQMSIISSKYIQVSIVGNYTQKGKDSNELILV